MKTKLSFSLFFLIAHLSLLTAQVPQGFNYQAIARNGSGSILANTPLQAMMYVQSLSTGGTIFWKELHSTITTNDFGLFTLVIGTGTRQIESTVATFDLIDWSVTPKYLKTQIYYDGSWKEMGTSQLLTVPYAMTSGDLAGTIDKLAVKGTTSGLEDALFEVKNKDGQTVFAVYNEGVRVYVSNGAKAVKGGFAIGGFGTDKAESTKYLFVGKDSVRIYLDANPLTKGKKSGFAVGGYDLTKDTQVQNYLDVSSDSVRIYIDSNPATKKLKGGFAVGGYDMTKGTNTSYMNVNTDESGIINPSQNRILWYPLKNAFLTGKVRIGTPDSVGENSFASGYESKARGMYSQALGYKAIANGDHSTAIGYRVIASGMSSTSIGSVCVSSAYASTSLGWRCNATNDCAIALGAQSTASGRFSVAMVQFSVASGEKSVAIGFGSTAVSPQGIAIGEANYSAGVASLALGRNTRATGTTSTSVGQSTTASGIYSFSAGYNTTAQSYLSAVFGYNNVIAGNDTAWIPTDPLFVIGNGISSPSNAFTVLKNGNTGIGSSNPSTKLDVIGCIRSQGEGFPTTGSGIELGYISGSHGIIQVIDRTSSPVYRDLRIGGYVKPSGDNLFGLGSSTLRWTSVYAVNGTIQTSDMRLKDNITSLNYGMESIMKLNPVSFNWKDDPENKKHLGLLAQDVIGIINEVVDTGDDPDKTLGINYSQLVPVLIKGMQEQQQHIESTKQENQLLKSELQSLKDKMDTIEAMLAKGRED